MIIFNLNTVLIIILFYIIAFSIYVLKLYIRNSRNPNRSSLPSGILLGILLMLIFYIIILSYLIKIPSFKSNYVYECFPVRYLPLPMGNEQRCSNIVLFNLTFPLEANRVVNVKPEKLLNNHFIPINGIHGSYSPINYENCVITPGTSFFYYCMEYASRDTKLYFMNVKNA